MSKEQMISNSKLPVQDKSENPSTRQYLESTVVNYVMQGMAELSKERPDKPLEFLGNYLLKKSKELEG